MALPTKRRGFRTITIDNELFDWRFSGNIDIRPKNNKSNKLIINIGYYDIWLYVNDNVKPPDFETKIVTPEFIKKCIISAIELGWDINKLNEEFNLKYINNKFQK
ncbi:MAG: hypothetical protein U0354_09425 [Candidatus Sericytochromatia bacterium]